MSPAIAIARREFAAFFRLPVGWVVIALYLFLSGLLFANDTLTPGQPASMRYFFGWAALLLIVVCPAISMRLFSEELRTGTIEPLMTAPVSDWSLALGKYLGGCAYVLAMHLPTLVYPLTLALTADPLPDAGPIIAGYLAVGLLAMFYLAVGMVASALTSSQTLAFLATLLVLAGLTLATGRLAQRLPPPLDAWLLAAAPSARVEDFAKGIIDTRHVVFFLAASAWFVVLATAALASRRWR